MPIRTLSLGAGVQSSAIALMSAVGELPPLDFAIFADTRAEPASVYKWLDWLEAQLPYPVHRAQKGDGLEAHEGSRTLTKERTGARYVPTRVPYWMHDGAGMGGALRRGCTRDYKIRPIIAKVRELVRPPRGAREVWAEQWIGISTDEAHRMKPARDAWLMNRFPLIEARMSRADCLRWMRDRGYPRPPRSSCVFCPYHSPQEWRRLQTEEPQEYERAAVFEERIRSYIAEHDETIEGRPCLSKMGGRTLREIDWDAELKTGQIELFADHWGNECEGMCGV